MRWDEWLEDGTLGPYQGSMMGWVLSCAQLSCPKVTALLSILHVIRSDSAIWRGKGPDSAFSSPESHPPHKVAQERGGGRLWQQEDRRRAAGCSRGLPAVQGDPPVVKVVQTSRLGSPLPLALMVLQGEGDRVLTHYLSRALPTSWFLS